jgi:hypothetical protein
MLNEIAPFNIDQDYWATLLMKERKIFHNRFIISEY